MVLTLMIIVGFLSFLFIAVGVFKLIRTKEQIVTGGGAWAAEFSPLSIKIIGAAECVLALSLIYCLFLSDSPRLAVFSLAGMSLIMLAATVVHIKRMEYGFVALTIVVAGMAIFPIVWICFSLAEMT